MITVNQVLLTSDGNGCFVKEKCKLFSLLKETSVYSLFLKMSRFICDKK